MTKNAALEDSTLDRITRHRDLCRRIADADRARREVSEASGPEYWRERNRQAPTSEIHTRPRSRIDQGVPIEGGRPHLIWDAAAVMERLKAALDTINAGVNRDQRRLSRQASSWPEYARRATEAYGYSEAHVRRATPHATMSLERASSIVCWLTWLDEGMGRVVWARVWGTSYVKIGRMIGRSGDTARRRVRRGLDVMAGKLNKKSDLKIHLRSVRRL